MTTTVPETPIRGKTPETYTPVWLACQGDLPEQAHARQATDTIQQEYVS
jgi:hypothetical protein